MAFSLHTLLSLSYLVFFVFFYNDKYADILFFNQIIDAKNYNVNLRNLSFTILETSLFIIIYAFYKYGITSNSKYPNHTNLVIGIGGDSGVGKTTLLKGLTNIFHDQLLELEGDGEHKWERGDKHWDNFTHLDPKANHIHQQTKIICDLKNDKKIYRRNYDHSSGKISDPILIEPKKIIVIAGLHPFYLPKLRANIDLKIFLDTDEKLKKHWKILRDVKHRGYTKEKVLEQIETRLGDAQKYIYPQKDFADIIINFFPNQNFEIGNPQDKPSLGLRIIFDANIHIEDILEYLDCEFMWDYNQDLKSQFVELKNAPQINISDIAHKVIDNLQDLIPPSANWEKGYFGLIQIILLRMISEKMKDKEYQ